MSYLLYEILFLLQGKRTIVSLLLWTVSKMEQVELLQKMQQFVLGLIPRFKKY